MELKYKKLKNKISDFISQISLESRSLSVFVLMLAIFAYLLSGLVRLQIVLGRENLLAATRTSQSTELVLPARGLILDSTGQILAYNSARYTVYVEKDKLEVDREREVLTEIANAFKASPEELIDVYRKAVYANKPSESEIKIMQGIDSATYFAGLEKVSDIEGVRLKNESIRVYKDPEYFSNIVGYIGKPEKSELGENIYTISNIGKSGIEKVYESHLQGKAGKKVLQSEYMQDIVSSYTQENEEPGDNIVLSIDGQWQKKITDIMEESLTTVEAFASAGIVMNSDTGEVKAMVSLPNFDNNLFINAIKNEQYESLLSDPRSPLINRPIALQLPSGSIYKIVGASALLEEGILGQGDIIRSEGCIKLSAGVEFCEADRKVLGDLNVVSALSKSSNLFFCKAAMRLNEQAEGINTLTKYAKEYGLGQRTGIDLLGEQEGSLPSPELKRALFNEGWYVGDDCNSIIGQGLLTVTPIQMVVAVSAIHNGGKVLKPSLMKEIVNQEGIVVQKNELKVLRALNVSQENLETIKEGMRSAAEEGSANILKGMAGDILIKTGSADAAEVINGKLYEGAHSWVMGCFNNDGSNYCFVFMQQWGGRGFQTVPIVKKFINCVQKDFESKCQDIN